jgi:hypothetical protein
MMDKDFLSLHIAKKIHKNMVGTLSVENQAKQLAEQ